ncbi:MAG TPA: SMC-Scp complex subunit ScpB [Gammaproteobacteria bacterium]|nr:SMC-Scp complex subunit ScpB [Gammaproteobacteria bacterium]
MTSLELQNILEAALMVAGRPLTIQNMQKLFDESAQLDAQQLRAVIKEIRQKYESSGIELRELASGYQFQAKVELSPWLSKLWEERPPRYSRALLETLALIAYRQPITRAEVEEIRGVTASSHIIKTLLEREWIKVLGYRDVPGKPAIYGTTKVFLDYFNLKNLDELPTLAELKDLESQEAKLQVQLELAPTEDQQADISEEVISSGNDTALTAETSDTEAETSETITKSSDTPTTETLEQTTINE